MAKEIRCSGILQNSANSGSEEILNSESIEEFGSALSDFQESYSKLRLKASGYKAKRAYFVSFYDDPSLIYISFNTSREKAKWEAVLYFSKFSPKFSDKNKKFLNAKRGRLPEFDKYSINGKIPIKELLQKGMVFSCAVCGKGSLNWESVLDKKGFIVKDGFEMNPFTEGIIICPHCYYKRFK